MMIIFYPNIIVKILPSFVGSITMEAIFSISFIYATHGRGKNLGWYNDDTKQE